MTTQKRKIKRKWGTYAQLTTPGTLLPSQWALSEDTSELIMRTHNELSYDLVILSGLAPSGNFINNNELVTQTAGFNISGNAIIGSDIFLTSGTATQKISSSYGLRLETNSGSIIMDTSGGSALSLPHFDTLNEPFTTPNNRNGTVYYNDDTHKLRLLANGVWVDLSTGVGSGETNTASNVGTGPIGIFLQKTGVDLEFKTIIPGSGISLFHTDVTLTTLSLSVDDNAFTASNVGTGVGTGPGGEAGVFKQKTITNFEFKTIVGDLSPTPTLIITDSPDNVYIQINESNMTLDYIGGTLSANKGGTGFGSYSIGDILYADTSSTLSIRSIGSSGDVLTVSGGIPVWAAPSSSGPSDSDIASLDPGNIVKTESCQWYDAGGTSPGGAFNLRYMRHNFDKLVHIFIPAFTGLVTPAAGTTSIILLLSTGGALPNDIKGYVSAGTNEGFPVYASVGASKEALIGTWGQFSGNLCLTLIRINGASFPGSQAVIINTFEHTYFHNSSV